jgi:hypothetical protein
MAEKTKVEEAKSTIKETFDGIKSKTKAIAKIGFAVGTIAIAYTAGMISERAAAKKLDNVKDVTPEEAE